MEPLLDGLQLVGFLMVSATILTILVAVAISIEIFRYLTDRKIVIVQGPQRPRESDVPAEIRS